MIMNTKRFCIVIEDAKKRTFDYYKIEEYDRALDGKCRREWMSEEEATKIMEELLTTHENAIFVDDHYIDEDREDGQDISWYRGEGFYRWADLPKDRKKIDFYPMTYHVEEDCRWWYYVADYDSHIKKHDTTGRDEKTL